MIRLTREEITERVKVYENTFDIVRVLGKDHTSHHACLKDGQLTDVAEPCFNHWNLTSPCVNCITDKALLTKTNQKKMEVFGKDIYHVTAEYVEMDGEPTVIEMISRLTDEQMSGLEACPILKDLVWDHALTEAKRVSAQKSSFLFNMSHDIRTPMNAIIGYTDLLEKNLGNEDKEKDYIRKIRISSDYLLDLINNVLEMSRIESGEMVLEEEPVNVSELADSVFQVFAEQMEEKGIFFTKEVRVKHPVILGDETKLKEILLNLVSNAYKYTPSGKSVHFSVTELGGLEDGRSCYCTVVLDTGIGMQKEFLPKIFDEFSREKTSTESKVTGTGLGLPIAKKLVGLMHGTITVESEPGKGSRFTVTIPHKIGEDTKKDRKKEIIHPDTPDFTGKHILLAEDNELNAEIAIEILKNEGFIVDWAENGESCVEILNAAEAGAYDLILMDIQMPVMDGYTAARTIRELSDKEKAAIPIVAMTANAFKEDREDALTAGMNEHIAKPIRVEELFRVIAQFVR